MPPDISHLAEAIQLALAPAFLLSGIGALLNVMTGRLARIVDRGRELGHRRAERASAVHPSVELETQTLEPRRHLTSVAITATTTAALLVCMVIAAIFVEVMLQTPLKWLISAFFAAAMFALMVGLTFLLREVHLAMQTVRIGAHEHWEADELGVATQSIRQQITRSAERRSSTQFPRNTDVSLTTAHRDTANVAA
jgi:hypothetical protein